MPASSGSTLPLDHFGGRLAVFALDFDFFFQLGFQINVGTSAAEELAEHSLEMLAHGVEGLLKSQARFAIDRVDQFFELLFGIGEIGVLLAKELLALLEFVQLADGVKIDIAKALNLAREAP